MNATCFDVSLAAGVAQITLNHPERMNLMTREFWVELPRTLRALDAAGTTRVAVIASTGKHFSAATFEDLPRMQTASAGA